jgi:hypothetical protein
MTIIYWPDFLPQKPLLDSFSEQSDPQIAEFQSDIGETLTRRRSTVEIKRMSMNFLMSYQQLSNFKDFYKKSIANGALAFYMPHPITGDAVKVKLGSNGYTYNPVSNSSVVLQLRLTTITT